MLVTGSFSGPMQLFLNVGRTNDPRFSTSTTLFSDSYNIYPRIYDLNGNGVVDFIRGINWGSFVVLPTAQVSFPVSKGESHYYPARETDAAPIRLGDESKIEYEKFLFYRGIGNPDLPLTVKLVSGA